MNKMSISIIAAILYGYTIYSMDQKDITQQKKLMVYEAARQNRVPVLLVNGYIVKGMSAWRIFKTEEFLLNVCAWRLHKQRIHLEKNNECSILVKRPSSYPKMLCNKQQKQEQLYDYPDVYIEMQDRHPEHTIFSEQDLDHTQRFSSSGCVCLGNVACGTIMLGVILALTFCR